MPSVSRDGCGAGCQFRPSRHADGHGRCGHGAVQPLHQDRSVDAGLADRDRFVLSAGHGSMLLYAIHHLLGYSDMTMEQLKHFRQLGHRRPPVIRNTAIRSGSRPPPDRWGRGSPPLSAWRSAKEMMAARFGNEAGRPFHLCDRRRRLPAGRHQPRGDRSRRPSEAEKADRAVGRQQISIDGATSLSTSMNQPMRFKAAGWDVQRVDGHDPEAVAEAIERRARAPGLR
jgi:transketolase